MAEPKRTRRDIGAGCIGTRPRADGRYGGYVSLPNGKRQWVYGKTRAVARDKLRALRADVEQGRLPAKRETVAAYLARWLDAKRRGGQRAGGRRGRKVRPSALRRYEEIVARYLVPELGHLLVGALTPARVDQLTADLATRAIAAGTVANVYSVLRNALGWGVAREELPRNAAALADPPASEPAERRALGPEQIGALLRAARGDRLEALYWVAIATGLRFGELAGLRWAHVDLATGRLTIATKARRVGNQGILEDDSKTEAGDRGLTLPAVALAAIRRHLARQDAERAGWRRDRGLVFADTAGGWLESGNFRLRSWLPLLERAGLREAFTPPLVFNELRHTHASLLVTLGVDVKTLQARMGHAKATTSLDLYAHAITGADADAAARVDRLLRGVA